MISMLAIRQRWLDGERWMVKRWSKWAVPFRAGSGGQDVVPACDGCSGNRAFSCPPSSYCPFGLLLEPCSGGRCLLRVEKRAVCGPPCGHPGRPAVLRPKVAILWQKHAKSGKYLHSPMERRPSAVACTQWAGVPPLTSRLTNPQGGKASPSSQQAPASRPPVRPFSTPSGRPCTRYAGK